MDFRELAEKYFKFHSEPLKKIELPSSKFFLESPNEVKDKIEHYQDILKKSLEYVRVERRCARSKGIWLEDVALCRVTKVVGNILKNFGFQDKSGIYLLPEETLFLVEQNKLELMNKTEQVSIYEAYTLIMKNITLKKYRVYKNLVEQGYKLLNKEAIRKFYAVQKKSSQSSVKNNKKRKQSSSSTTEKEIEVKKSKRNYEERFNVGKKNDHKQDIDFTELFDNLRKQGPRLVLPSETSKHPDYFGFLPNSRSKHNHEFNLYIREGIDSNDFDNYEHIPNIFAICTNDNVTFCRYPNINIPIINVQHGT
ncbi:uncharacterized protein LOC123317270 [Coccinella septempunctata]|uniref:uncharacterized protein LOC123317270 n=1 Tax=Coccinella septempunctata TaxID=41139 RepID=UPI001D05D330|nr:uncharacterized protein LOC123317270 [Coccinella septempunctata]